MDASIIVPNWNGRRFLQRAVAAILASVSKAGVSAEVIIVDDASTDGSGEEVAAVFPSVRLLRNERNQGFGASCNRGVQEANAELVILLNNDLVPRPDLVLQLVEPLQRDREVFGVTGRTIDWNGQEPNHVSMSARWAHGKFQLAFCDPPDTAPTMFLQGGCCAVRRAPFQEFGGFSPLFAPGYWEDYDISYLALKAGWRNLYAPKASAYHFGSGSMNRAHGHDYIRLVRQRNFFIFSWLNVTDPDLLWAQVRALPRAVTATDSQGDGFIRAKAFMRAVRYLAPIAAERKRRLGLLRRSDAEVLRDFANIGTLCEAMP